jgi:hypothetical protein
LRRNLRRVHFGSDDVALVLIWDPASPMMRKAFLMEVLIVNCVRVGLHNLRVTRLQQMSANSLRNSFVNIPVARCSNALRPCVSLRKPAH